jgi:hypothetical protein
MEVTVKLDLIRSLLHDLDIGSGMAIDGRCVFHDVDTDGHDFFTIDDESDRFRLTLETAARDLVDLPDLHDDEDDWSVGATEDEPVRLRGHDPDPPACRCGMHQAQMCPDDVDFDGEEQVDKYLASKAW